MSGVRKGRLRRGALRIGRGLAVGHGLHADGVPAVDGGAARGALGRDVEQSRPRKCRNGRTVRVRVCEHDARVGGDIAPDVKGQSDHVGHSDAVCGTFSHNADGTPEPRPFLRDLRSIARGFMLNGPRPTRLNLVSAWSPLR